MFVIIKQLTLYYKLIFVLQKKKKKDSLAFCDEGSKMTTSGLCTLYFR